MVLSPLSEDRVQGTLTQDASPFEAADERHVLDRHPGADSELVKRLGKAISQRKAILRYRERKHQEKLKHSSVDSALDAEEVQRPLGDDLYDEISDCETSYAPALFESPIPAPPKESADSQPFECPYCHFEIVVKDQKDWVRHIFDDILPYVCVFPGCRTSNKLFARRSEWYQHTERRHLKDVNSKRFTDRCPLCRDELLSEQFESHVALHMEQLALFALPCNRPEQTFADYAFRNYFKLEWTSS